MKMLFIFLSWVVLTVPGLCLDQLYQVNMKTYPKARSFVSSLPEKFNSFKETFWEAEKGMRRQKVNVGDIILKGVKDRCFKLRKPGIELKVSTVHRLEDLVNLMQNHFEIHFSGEVEAKKVLLEKEIHEETLRVLGAHKEYLKFLDTYGRVRDWPFKMIVNNLLGIGSEYSFCLDPEDKDYLINGLTKVGFIEATSLLTERFFYNPGVIIEKYLIEHKEVDRLILGCGHHLHGDVTELLGIPREGFCGACHLTPFHHGDLTIALRNDDLCDVVADMHDERIWKALKKHRWKLIGDHSWGVSVTNKATLQFIYEALDDEGIFELWDVGDSDIIRACEFGFKIFAKDEEKRVVRFKKH